ncbi:diaminopimelate decarboxylase [Mycobacterium montefiorense]|uniref:Diaminopimelate decarboxylase n=1 Tax=Mycobacterium montefiorense TaxID=154654 RepID=A0AA37UVG7_9MYCO|nr:diaminopimelate decarboxylase [Mycobacterium montefiorense]GBG35887.1 diaminopimelate decarboxylase [Mycobacterium montefiorense]GKU35391.1 diaminopimelate decarboxylase [Mycobacterium montefiorense]GKU40392.1 diaminopimelate decarboxylase [Mycobacterium montefiorense]GKU45770.1 diaminopimelate decarboxylase [Mycobacterium montefiorense]GKU50126.1 diaminopimelate decarboxylase [Mycobacterium montefiorense]
MTLFELLGSAQHELRPQLDRTIWPLSTSIDELGRICVGGVAATDIAAEFGTPAYLLDEQDFRARLRGYRAALPGVELVYAGKALLSTAVAEWAAAEGAGLDVWSSGELATALAAGVAPSRIILHGNAKTAAELDGAVDAGVGRIVIDSPNEIALLAARVRRRQGVLIRVIPAVEARGQRDDGFGFTVADGLATGAVKRALDQPSLNLLGLHCHLGSQLTDAQLYGAAIRELVALMAQVRDHRGVVLGELNLGGGYGVPYVSGDPDFSPYTLAAVIEAALASACADYSYPRPRIVIEPGRAIAARAGITLYREIAVKHQPEGRTFVVVDGQMADNPHEGLRGMKHTVALANWHEQTSTTPVTIVGRHCEAGEEIARDIELPDDVHPGDLLAVACTGAYHYSMGAACNLVGRPPLIAVTNGRPRALVRRETLADLLVRDCDWSHPPHRSGSVTMDIDDAKGE